MDDTPGFMKGWRTVSGLLALGIPACMQFCLGLGAFIRTVSMDVCMWARLCSGMRRIWLGFAIQCIQCIQCTKWCLTAEFAEACW
jgi:hypothetical protein